MFAMKQSIDVSHVFLSRVHNLSDCAYHTLMGTRLATVSMEILFVATTARDLDQGQPELSRIYFHFAITRCAQQGEPHKSRS